MEFWVSTEGFCAEIGQVSLATGLRCSVLERDFRRGAFAVSVSEFFGGGWGGFDDVLF